MPSVSVLTSGDNYMYVVPCGAGNAFVIDPTEAAPVRRFLEKNRLRLAAILNTHHHRDHTAGNNELMRVAHCRVIAGRTAGDVLLHTGNWRVTALATPGHTRDGVCYYAVNEETQERCVFTGDTVFISGCGRLFEGTAAMLWHSIETLRVLPDDTLVYPGHEYTVENCAFACSIMPEDEALKKYREEMTARYAADGGTVPSTIGQEKKTNLFFRCDDAAVAAAVGAVGSDPAVVCGTLRARKDRF